MAFPHRRFLIGGGEVLSQSASAQDNVVIAARILMLARGDSVSIISLLNTAGWSRGRHLIAVYAHPVPSEFDVDNNARTCGPVTVTISGDVNGDFAVGILDIVMITSGTCSEPETHDSNLTATSTTTATSTSLIWSSA